MADPPGGVGGVMAPETLTEPGAPMTMLPVVPGTAYAELKGLGPPEAITVEAGGGARDPVVPKGFAPPTTCTLPGGRLPVTGTCTTEAGWLELNGLTGAPVVIGTEYVMVPFTRPDCIGDAGSIVMLPTADPATTGGVGGVAKPGRTWAAAAGGTEAVAARTLLAMEGTLPTDAVEAGATWREDPGGVKVPFFTRNWVPTGKEPVEAVGAGAGAGGVGGVPTIIPEPMVCGSCETVTWPEPMVCGICPIETIAVLCGTGTGADETIAAAGIVMVCGGATTVGAATGIEYQFCGGASTGATAGAGLIGTPW